MSNNVIETEKLTHQWLEENIDQKLLEAFMEKAKTDRILASTTESTTTVEFTQRLMAACICLANKGYMLEDQLMSTLSSKVDNLKELKKDSK